MSVEELRRSFLFGTTLEQKIREFRQERLKILERDEGPFSLIGREPTLTIHLVPQAAYSENFEIPLRNEVGLMPMSTRTGYDKLHSLDGLVTYSGLERELERAHSFTTLFRNGCVEAVGRIDYWVQDGNQFIKLQDVEKDAIFTTQQILNFFERSNMPTPYYMMASITGVQGFHAPIDAKRGIVTYPCRRKNILLPELVINEENIASPVEDNLAPIIEMVWNAFGHSGSPGRRKN